MTPYRFSMVITWLPLQNSELDQKYNFRITRDYCAFGICCLNWLINTWFLVDILWKLNLTTEIVLIPEMMTGRQKMLFRQKIQSYGPDTNDFREFSIICKLNWERVWYFINNVLFNSKIVIFNQRTNRNEQNGTVHNSTSLIEHRYRLILLEWKNAK